MPEYIFTLARLRTLINIDLWYDFSNTVMDSHYLTSLLVNLLTNLLNNHCPWLYSDPNINSPFQNQISGIHVDRKFLLENNFQHFRESRFGLVLCCEFPLTSNSHNFSNCTWIYAEIDKFFTQNHEKWGKLSFVDFTFHAYAENG